MRKGEIACYKQFLPFSQCFLQLFIFCVSKCGILWKWDKSPFERAWFVHFSVFQSKGLPKPVMYVPPKEDEDEIKTNPDLFSDTNSNRGSQAAMEEGMFPIPDSASEASVEIGDIHVRQQLKLQQQQQHPHFQQRFNPHELDVSL